MNQFDVRRLKDGTETVCVIQTDLAVVTPYILCAPVLQASDWGRPVPRLHLPITLDGEWHFIIMSQLVSLPSKTLGDTISSTSTLRDEIIRAVDLLVVGF